MKRATKDLKPHPLNDSIYGDTADEQLIQSIRENGILQPLIIDHKNRIVSGHRRWDAAKTLELKEVPVELFRSENELDIQTALVEANRQRIKTNEQQAREASQIFKIEQERARQRQGSANRKGKLPAISPEPAGDARELAGKQVGVGGKKIMQSVQVIEAIECLEKAGDHEGAEKIKDELNKYSVSRAHKVALEKGHLKGVAMAPETEDDFILIKQWKAMPKAKQVEALTKLYGKSSFNFQDTAGIEWARWSWNPISGCLHGCEYCYARDFAKWTFKPKFEPAFYPGRLHCPEHTTLPPESKSDIGLKNVFACSMADLFGRWVPKDLIQAVLDVVRANPQWNFLFLTKCPQRYLDFAFPVNAWIWVPATSVVKANNGHWRCITSVENSRSREVTTSRAGSGLA